MDEQRAVGVLGATSLVGKFLLPELPARGYRVIAFSRKAKIADSADVEWRLLQKSNSLAGVSEHIPNWICLAPVWALPELFDTLAACGAKKIVTLSSTSVFSKKDSSDPEEQALANRLAGGESSLFAWAGANGVDVVVLRSTLIYSLGNDINITEIARLVKRFGFFPVLGVARGLRQPVFAGDVALACLQAMESTATVNRTYNLSGGETLSYRDMVERVFLALGKTPRIVHVPMSLFKIGIAVLRRISRYRHWSPAMAERMNRDLVFDHTEATRDFGFDPCAFLAKSKNQAAP